MARITRKPSKSFSWLYATTFQVTVDAALYSWEIESVRVYEPFQANAA